MDGAPDINDRSTSLNISGKLGLSLQTPSEASAAVEDHLQPLAMKELSEAFLSLSRHIQNLNSLLLNGIPLHVEVTTPPPVNNVNVEIPAPVNHFKVDIPPAPNVLVEPKIVVDPMIRVDSPVVRIDNQPSPSAPIENRIVIPENRWTKKQVTFVIAAYVLFMLSLLFGLGVVVFKIWKG